LSKFDIWDGFTCSGKISNYSEEDIMMFARINHLYKGNDRIKYNDLIDLIFKDAGNEFNSIVVSIINEYMRNNCDIQALFSKIKSKNEALISFKEMSEYVKKLNPDTKNPLKLISKFDLDQDGNISQEDLKSVLEKYMKSTFMKYENNDHIPDLNIFPPDTIETERFKLIIKDLKLCLEKMGVNEHSLFKMLDNDGDGFINFNDFFNNIDKIINLGPSIKDQFFASLDRRRNGLVDLNTFLELFKENNSSPLAENDWNNEDILIEKFNSWIISNKNLSSSEIFALLDKDCDGSISVDDFINFLVQSLNLRKIEIQNRCVIERTIQKLCISFKSKSLTFYDLKMYNYP
jgi:Ca2+-binding EF-hand superfamily protein